MHRPPLFVHSHLGVNFSVLYFRTYGPLPHCTLHSLAGHAVRGAWRRPSDCRSGLADGGNRPGGGAGRPTPPSAPPPGRCGHEPTFFIKVVIEFLTQLFLQICNELRSSASLEIVLVRRIECSRCILISFSSYSLNGSLVDLTRTASREHIECT